MVIEGIVRIWLYQIQTCEFEESSLYSNLTPSQRRDLCFSHYEIKRTFNELLPNQDLSSIHINNYGFRGNDISLSKDDNTIRIFLVGGSTAFGSGSTSDNTTISGYLQQKFEHVQSGINVEIINAGIHGIWSQYELSLIKNKIIKFNPDIVIVYDGWNDLVRHPYFKSTSIIQNSFDGTMEKSDYFQINLEKTFLEVLPYYKTPIAISYFLSTTQHFVNDKIEYKIEHAFHNDEELQKIIYDWQSNWEEICELGTKSNFKTIMSLQPIPGSGLRLLTDQEYKNFKFFEDRKILDAYNEFGTKLENLDQNCSKIVDLRNVFDKTPEPIYWDYIHVGDRGNEIIANKLYYEILPFINKINLSNSKPIKTEFDHHTNISILSKQELQKIDLIGTDLSYIDLSSHDLSYLQLIGTNLTNANLSKANLTSTNLSQSILKNANLYNATLFSANLELANLKSANFSGTNLSHVLFLSANFSDKDLNHSQLLGIKIPFSFLQKLDLSGKDMSNSIFRGSDLSYSKLNNSKLNNADLAYSKFVGADLSNSQLVDAILHHVDLSGANLANSLIVPYSSSYMNIIESNFSNANLTNTDLRFANLQGSNFTGAILINTDLRNANLTNVIFKNAIIIKPIIENTDLHCLDHEICN